MAYKPVLLTLLKLSALLIRLPWVLRERMTVATQDARPWFTFSYLFNPSHSSIHQDWRNLAVFGDSHDSRVDQVVRQSFQRMLVESFGIDNVPDGRVLLIGNPSGQLPFDALHVPLHL